MVAFEIGKGPSEDDGQDHGLHHALVPAHHDLYDHALGCGYSLALSHESSPPLCVVWLLQWPAPVRPVCSQRWHGRV
jgi:hypothetical protein